MMDKQWNLSFCTTRQAGCGKLYQQRMDGKTRKSCALEEGNIHPNASPDTHCLFLVAQSLVV
jgi:hypothetical protein